MYDLIVVGLAEVKVSTRTEEVLVAYSLGSCVGVALWDPVAVAGGLAHVVLPSRTGMLVSGRSACSGRPDEPGSPGKYADAAVPYLISRLRENGCETNRLRAWVAGGAHVLRGLEWPFTDIGLANARAVVEALKALGVAPPRKDVGADYGRTMRLHVADGRVTVSSIGRTEREI